MDYKVFGINRFAKLYFALIYLHKMNPLIVADLLFELNAAHLRSRRMVENIALTESSKKRFMLEVRARGKPHHTLLTLYMELECLRESIVYEYISENQRDACKALGMVMFGIRSRFKEQNKYDIEAALLADRPLKTSPACALS